MVGAFPLEDLLCVNYSSLLLLLVLMLQLHLQLHHPWRHLQVVKLVLVLQPYVLLRHHFHVEGLVTRRLYFFLSCNVLVDVSLHPLGVGDLKVEDVSF